LESTPQGEQTTKTEPSKPQRHGGIRRTLRSVLLAVPVASVLAFAAKGALDVGRDYLSTQGSMRNDELSDVRQMRAKFWEDPPKNSEGAKSKLEYLDRLRSKEVFKTSDAKAMLDEFRGDVQQLEIDLSTAEAAAAEQAKLLELAAKAKEAAKKAEQEAERKKLEKAAADARIEALKRKHIPFKFKF
jgi:hypothetical protein